MSLVIRHRKIAKNTAILNLGNQDELGVLMGIINTVKIIKLEPK